MLKVQEIKELIRAVNQSDLDEFKFEQDGTKLVLRKEKAQAQSMNVPAAPVVAEPVNPSPAQNSVPQVKQIETSSVEVVPKAAATNLHTITSPMVGTFYSAPSPDADVYVKQGDEVSSDSVVCIIEAMKLMNEIEAEVKGKIVEVLAENGELVEYGQPLFVVEPR